MIEKTVTQSERGKVLTIYLVILIIISLGNLYFDFSGKTRTLPLSANFPNWMFYWFTAAHLIGLIFFYGMWKMKKWGVFGAITLIVFGNILHLYFRHSSRDILMSGIGILIFALVIWKPFKRMT